MNIPVSYLSIFLITSCWSVIAAFTTTCQVHRPNPRHSSTATRFRGEGVEPTTTDAPPPRRRSFGDTAVPGPPSDTKPDYDRIVGPLGRFADGVFRDVFRVRLARQVGDDGRDASPPGYAGIVDLAARMNRELSDRTEIHARAQRVLRDLFPSWMPVRTVWMYVCGCVSVTVCSPVSKQRPVWGRGFFFFGTSLSQLEMVILTIAYRYMVLVLRPTGLLRRVIFETLPRLLVPHERVGYQGRRNVVDGRMRDQRRGDRWWRNRPPTGPVGQAMSLSGGERMRVGLCQQLQDTHAEILLGRHGIAPHHGTGLRDV